LGAAFAIVALHAAIGSARQNQEPLADQAIAERIPIAVLPLGLSPTTFERYPQLAERSVGFGVHSMLVEHLYDTGRFRFVEDKPEVIEDLLERQWVSASGAMDPGSAVEHGRLLGARYVLYGEVYEFATRRLGRRESEATIGIQVRLVDVTSTEYVPASGRAVVHRRGEVFPGELELARSTVGVATDQALDEAIGTLMRRFVAPPP
jgi:curli biogenesis system outer membrane secretion channel CsgG